MGTTTVTCECGAVYEREEHKLTFRDRDRHDCDFCGRVIESWSGSILPTFRLIKRPEAKERENEKP